MNVLLAALLLPLMGTVIGACGVFVKTAEFSRLKPYLLSLSAGIMLASSLWSLLVPAFEDGSMLFPFTGLWTGVLFIMLVERITMKHMSFQQGKTACFMTAVTVHNIPEGVAAGVAAAAALVTGNAALSASAFSLAIGIALQNIPEGAVISMPLFYGGNSRRKSFVLGVLSGIPEPVFAFAAVFFSGRLAMLLPLFLGFAAGAMIYVTVFDMLREMWEDGGGKISAAVFFMGFTIMTAADMLV